MTTTNLTIGLSIVAALVIGFLLGRLNAPMEISTQNNQPSMQSTRTGTTTSASSVESFVAGMSDDQKKMLNALGIDPNNITPAMIVCAETSLGAGRLQQISTGAELSFSEKAKLLACYNE